MFGIGNRNSCKDYGVQDLKIENARIKIHAKYIAFISLGIVVWMMATGTANTEDFSDTLSFASTIASIILSVIAIIMSISGEAQTNTIRDRMEEAVREMDQVLKSIEKENKTSFENTKELKDAISELDYKIANMPDIVIEKMEKRFNVSINKEESGDVKVGWVNNSGK